MSEQPMTPPNPNAVEEQTEAEILASAPERDCPNVEAGVPHEGPHLWDFADATTDPGHDWGKCPGA